MIDKDLIIKKWQADLYDQNIGEADMDAVFPLALVGDEPKRVLEIACGSGRILTQLAKMGHTAFGLDSDDGMLSRLEARAEGLKGISWRKADALKADWGKGYDIVLLAANLMFNIVTDMGHEKAQKLFVRKAAEALIPGGYVYIDYNSFSQPEKVYGNPVESVIWDGADSEGNKGRMILSGGGYDKRTGILTFTRRFEITLVNGEYIEENIPSVKRHLPLEQLHGWLENAGLVIEAEYGDYEKHPVGENTSRAIIWARKR